MSAGGPQDRADALLRGLGLEVAGREGDRIRLAGLSERVWVRLHSDEFTRRRLRLSLTEHCNFGCFFCHNEGQGPVLPRSDTSLTVDEIAAVTKAALSEGVRRIALTGGEPLMYRSGGDSVVDLVARLQSLRERHRPFEMGMTTNGSLLPELAAPLRAAGLTWLTVSITTLDPHTFTALIGSRRHLLDRSLEGLRVAAESGFESLNINAALYHSDRRELGNLDELTGLAALATANGVSELKIYTLLWHSGFTAFDEYYQFFSERVEHALAALFARMDIERPEATVATLSRMGRAFAEVTDPKLEFGIDVDATSLSFEAMRYGRLPQEQGGQEGPYAMRLGADGALRASLLGAPSTELITAIREGRDEDRLRQIYRAALKELA